MDNKQAYIARLQAAISQLHDCGAVWRETVPVHEIFQGHTVWHGKVEIFDLTGHPTAKRAYGWTRREGKENEDERFVTVLELPPVDSPQSAVKAAIMSDGKEPKNETDSGNPA